MKTKSLDTPTIDELLLTFEKNAVDAWKDNKTSDVALVRKLRPNRTKTERAIYDLLIEKAIGLNKTNDGGHEWEYMQAIPISAINQLFGKE